MEQVVKDSVGVEVSIPTVKVDYPNKTQLGQLHTKVNLVLLDDNYKTLHQPVYCKDYFNEVFATELDKKKRTQYGFVSEKFPIDVMTRETFKFGLLSDSKDGNNKLINVFEGDQYVKGLLTLLNEIEINRGFNLTTIEDTTEPNVKVLHSDTKWMDTAVYFSFYTLMIRMAYNYDGTMTYPDFLAAFKSIDSSKKINGGEHYAFASAIPFLIYLYEGGKVNQPWSSLLELNSSTLHNSSGLCTFYANNKSDLNKIKKDAEEKERVSSDDPIETSNS